MGSESTAISGCIMEAGYPASTKAASTGHPDVSGFRKCAVLVDVHSHGQILYPDRHIGTTEVEDNGEPFEEKMRRLVAQLREQQAEARRLDETIWNNLSELGCGG